MSGISPVESTIFTNQMTPAVASNQNSHQNRVDFQNMVAQSQIQEKDEKVIEVRPTEENQEVDEDREHTRDEADRESKRNRKFQEEDDEDSSEPLHRLDIKV